MILCAENRVYAHKCTPCFFAVFLLVFLCKRMPHPHLIPDSIWNPSRREEKRREMKRKELKVAEAEKKVESGARLGIEIAAAAVIE